VNKIKKFNDHETVLILSLSALYFSYQLVAAHTVVFPIKILYNSSEISPADINGGFNNLPNSKNFANASGYTEILWSATNI